MCGIGGILFSADTGPVLRKKIETISKAQRHRGPDDERTLVLGQHALCHQRLSLLDAAGGAQPFTDPGGRYHIVYNGEIYNHATLREVLRPHYDFHTRCDTEVVLAAYMVWGEACVERFNGMFSFLIWDQQNQQAFAARDPLGVKPFAYLVQQGTFYFASEIKALLRVLDQAPLPDASRLAEYVIAPSLSGNGASSIFQGIRYLESGTLLRFGPDGLRLRTWYQFNWQTSNSDEYTLISEIDDALQQSVRLSMQADVPVGAFLSGGLDSSLLATLAAQHSPHAIEAFTIAFENHDQINFDPGTIVNSDDLPFARQVATQIKAGFHQVTIQHPSLENSLRELAQINERIPVWEQEFSQHHLSRAASRRVKAVLVGDAADETNYGYYFLLNDQVNHSPLGLMNLFGGEKRATMLSPKLRQALDPLQQLDAEYRQLVCKAGVQFGRSEAENILAMSVLVNRRWLARLLHNGDIHTMHFGLEARVPFANRNMLYAVSQVGPALGFKMGVEKYMLRQVALRHMPATLALRKKSSLPRDPRLGVAYQAILQQLLTGKNDFIDTYLDRKALEALSRQPTVPEADRLLLFNMISLIQWASHYVQ